MRIIGRSNGQSLTSFGWEIPAWIGEGASLLLSVFNESDRTFDGLTWYTMLSSKNWLTLPSDYKKAAIVDSSYLYYIGRFGLTSLQIYILNETWGSVSTLKRDKSFSKKTALNQQRSFGITPLYPTHIPNSNPNPNPNLNPNPNCDPNPNPNPKTVGCVGYSRVMLKFYPIRPIFGGSEKKPPNS